MSIIEALAVGWLCWETVQVTLQTFTATCGLSVVPSLQVVEYLLEQKADPYVRNNKGETALDLAAQFGHVEVVREGKEGRGGKGGRGVGRGGVGKGRGERGRKG